jgi:hypothetical protein
VSRTKIPRTKITIFWPPPLSKSLATFAAQFAGLPSIDGSGLDMGYSHRPQRANLAFHEARSATIDASHQDLSDDGRSGSREDGVGGCRRTLSRRRYGREHEGGLAGVRLLVPDDYVEAALKVLEDA